MQIDTLALAYRAGQRAFRAGLALGPTVRAYADPSAQAACFNGYFLASAQAGVDPDSVPCKDLSRCPWQECQIFRVCKKTKVSASH